MTIAKMAIICALSMFATNVAADSALEARLATALNKVIPDAEITGISPGPLPGLYEVMMGPSLLYVSADGRFVFKGDVFDLNSLENVTRGRRAQARVDAFAGLGVDNMIEYAPTNRKTVRTLYVYTDIDCAYCRKMHLEVGELNHAGIAVRYLAYPRSGLAGESYDKAVAVWCASNRQNALTAAKAGKEVKSEKCKNPVKEHYHMGEAMGVRGTPAVYLDDGESIGGYIPAKEVIRMLTSIDG